MLGVFFPSHAQRLLCYTLEILCELVIVNPSPPPPASWRFLSLVVWQLRRNGHQALLYTASTGRKCVDKHEDGKRIPTPTVAARGDATVATGTGNTWGR